MIRDTTVQLAFRADIQGLRAVAILLVMAAHAHVPGLAGGFVGVDVFFVLSGYLISGLLIRELDQDGSIDFARFYARRLRRLLPGLMVMLVLTCAAATLLLGPEQQRDQALSAASAALWLSNFFFCFASLGYFDPDASSNLFLHTWSLGVEEQFYLIWPVLVTAAFVGAQWRAGTDSRSPTRRTLIGVMALVLVISLSLCLGWTPRKPDWAFYMMPSRAWQFALGALTYLATERRLGHADESVTGFPYNQLWFARTSDAGGWIGVCLIGLSALTIHTQTPYPGYAALLPSLGAALVIAAGARARSSGPSLMLRARPMGWIGDLSYAWYLWHWPALLLAEMVFYQNDVAARLASVACSLLLAAATHKWIETPSRRGNPRMVRPGPVIISGLLAMALATAATVSWHRWADGYLGRPAQQRYVEARKDAPLIYAMGCDAWIRGSALRPCEFGPSDAPRTAVIVGDSIALQWFPALANVFRPPEWRLIAITKSSCPMVDEPIMDARAGHVYLNCEAWREKVIAALAQMKPQVLVFGSTHMYPYSPSQWTDGTSKLLRRLANSVGAIRVLRSTPKLPFDGPACLAHRSWLQWAIPDRSPCVAPSADHTADTVYRALNDATRQFPNAATVDMNDAVCPGQRCSAEVDGMVTFRDSQHLTASFAQSLSADLERKLDLPARQRTHAPIEGSSE